MIGEHVDTDEEAPTPVCAWDADQCREYREYALRREFEEFAILYGWQQAWSLLWGSTQAGTTGDAGEVLS